ncbi:MAG: hypothetical protein GTN80_09240 [Nitrososphaeria archaeon]|nr:hypothetical protein [Nitrososphaeria archaeon]NIQ33804.1 hypothetical protein [Nitrososphaeria archaeon]
MRSKAAAVLAIISGILLIISGSVGSVGIIGIAIQYLIKYLSGPLANLLSVVLQLFKFIAYLGGISVIGGGILIYKGRKGLGKFVIRLGAGMGTIGFIIVVGSALLHGWAYTMSFIILMSQSTGWTGIILAIVATQLAR